MNYGDWAGDWEGYVQCGIQLDKVGIGDPAGEVHFKQV